MSSLHRKWSNRVAIPTGSGWAPSGSVAECLSWHPHSSSQEVQNHYGILKTGPQVTFNPDLEIKETTQISNTVETRAMTPCGRVLTPKPPSRNAWSSYRMDGEQLALDSLAKRTYSPQPPDVFRDTLIESQRPSSKYGMYDSTSKAYDVYQEASDAFRNQSRQAYDPDREELIRDFLTRKEIESYERQIEHEKQRLQDETHKAYEDHMRSVAIRNEMLREAAAADQLKTHRTHTLPHTPLDTYYSGRVSGRPPVPQPPTYGQTHYPRTPQSRKCTPQSHRASRPTSAALYAQDTTKNLDDMLTTKRVLFQSPRPGSSVGVNRDGRGLLTKKGEHFFQWRDAVSPAYKSTQYGDDQPWKMSRFTKSAHPRISTRWNPDSRVASAYRENAEKGKVNVNVQCAEGDKMDVELSISRSPTKGM